MAYYTLASICCTETKIQQKRTFLSAVKTFHVDCAAKWRQDSSFSLPYVFMFDVRLLFSVPNVTLICTMCASKCDVDSRRRDVIENEDTATQGPATSCNSLSCYTTHVYIQPASMYNLICYERIVTHPSYFRGIPTYSLLSNWIVWRT